MIVIVVVIGCALPAVQALAVAAPRADFYVAENGNDTWSGRLSEPNASGTDGPLASLRGVRDVIRKMKARSDLTKPVTVLMRGGTYRIRKPVEFLPIDSGSKKAPITYAAYPGEKPVISGGIPITGWKKGEGRLWNAKVPLSGKDRWRFREMWVNGKRCIPARTPNFGKAIWSNGVTKPTVVEEMIDPLFNYRHITYKPSDSELWDRLSESKDKGIFVVFHSFNTSKHNIGYIDKQRKAVVSPNPAEKAGVYDRRYYVAYNRQSLDAPGEWYLDADKWVVSYYPREGEDMTKAEVIVPSGRTLLKATGDAASDKRVEYLRFEGLTFQYTDWLMGDDSVMDGHSDMRGKRTRSAAVHMRYVENCELTACEISHTGNWALQLGEGSKWNKVEQCHLYDLGSGGVILGEIAKPEREEQRAERNVVHNCFIHHGGRVFHAAVGIWLGSSNYSTVSHNEISDFYWCGITASRCADFDKTEHNVIEYNHIHHLAWNVLKDLGGIYTTGQSPGTVIRNNVIHHISSIVRRGRGIYLDQGSADFVVENNLVYLVNDGAFHQNWGKNNTARNNIFVFADEYGVITGGGSWRSGGEKGIPYTFEGNIVCTRRSVPARNVNKEVRSKRNLYWRRKDPEKLSKWLAGEKNKRREADSIVADPVFIDAENFDFRIADTSPAISKIDFKPFDPRKAGLVGDKEWTSLPGKIKRPKMKFWSRRSREVNAKNETDRWKAGFTP